MTEAQAEWVTVMLLITIVNLGVLALTLKLYTEILKDSAFNRRANKELK